MTTPALDSLHRSRFDWPEPLVIDLLGETYGAKDDVALAAAVHLHARFLHCLVEDAASATPAVRAELVACCAARGIAAALVETAERAVFGELIRLAEMRFRNAPRTRDLVLRQLQAAIDAVTTRRPAAPTWKPTPLRERMAPRLRPGLLPTAA